MKRKMIITHNIADQELSAIKNVLPEWEIICGKNPEVWKNHLKDAEIIAGWKKGIEDEIFANGAKLKWMQSWSAGVNAMPLDAMQEKNIWLTSASGVHAYPISETIFALMLGLTRKIHTYVKQQQEKIWHHAHMKLEIHQKTIGIIGVGAIGKETAKIAKAFGMKVLGVRNSGKPDENVDEMYTSAELHTVLPQCDYVVVTLPLTKETHHLFTAAQFQLMKSSAFFINIGRGEIILEQDLIAALENGEIAGAGLDVFATEPLPESSPLWKMENVIITPHTAGSTEHYDKRVIHEILIPNLHDYLSGTKPTVNLVDYSKGY
ncbi:D-2-hydroxyacid dehydrogenase [Neobacillus sp. SM06]|uniref:D-2-hydroxyacid dehydrogenase n=1 Tax=Neobacillus sp. SM06 TaxID=3422492 RepID=UPI003D2C80F3